MDGPLACLASYTELKLQEISEMLVSFAEGRCSLIYFSVKAFVVEVLHLVLCYQRNLRVVLLNEATVLILDLIAVYLL